MIVCNQVRCLKCEDTPFSAHVHDFVRCKCGAVAVDGGQEYLRRVGNPSDMEDMSIEMTELAVIWVEVAVKEEKKGVVVKAVQE